MKNLYKVLVSTVFITTFGFGQEYNLVDMGASPGWNIGGHATIKDINDNVSEGDIVNFCKETLAGFKCPKKVIFRELPKTSTGKILKYELREIAKAS